MSLADRVVTGECYDAVYRAAAMAIDALDVLGMDGPGEVTDKQVRALARMVARSARSFLPPAGRPMPEVPGVPDIRVPSL